MNVLAAFPALARLAPLGDRALLAGKAFYADA